MNLYKILFSHHAPKDCEVGIKALLLAENDEQVYNWIASEPSTEISGFLPNSWKKKEKYTYVPEKDVYIDENGVEVDEDEAYSNNIGWYDEEGNRENFKQRIIRLEGEMYDDDYDFSDSYYGITLLGWGLLKENVTTDYSELIELGIVYKAVV